MSLYVLSLVLMAAVLHAWWNLLAKRAQGKAPFTWLMYVASNIIYLPAIVYELRTGENLFSPPLLLFSLGSAMLHLGYYSILQQGYRNADLSVVYPLARGAGPLFASAAAILFLHERLKLTSTLGLLLIIAGVLIITGLSFKKENNKNIMTGICYGVATGFFIALYTVNDTLAVKNYKVSPLTLTLVTNFFGAILLLPWIVTQKTELRREISQNKWSIIGIAVLSPAAYILVLEALKSAPLTVVAPAREISILLGVFMGSRVLKEEDGRRRLVASLLILGGIVALGVSWTRPPEIFPTYRVKQLKGQITIDGNWDKPAWQQTESAEIKNDIINIPTFHPTTEVKMLYDSANLYIIFRVQDRYTRSITTQLGGPVWKDAAVEFFFCTDTTQPEKYFNLEINCGGTPLMGYNSVRPSPDDIRSIQIAHSLPQVVDPEIPGPTTWTIECRIPLSTLAKYGDITKPAKGVTWKANFCKIAENNSNPHHMTWSPINAPNPNFHMPKFFGHIQFE